LSNRQYQSRQGFLDFEFIAPGRYGRGVEHACISVGKFCDRNAVFEHIVGSISIAVNDS
jgi:hypothetical protein